VTSPLLRAVDPQLSGSRLLLGSFEASGPLLVLVGAWGPLFELLAGKRRLRGGRLELGGAPLEEAAAQGRVGWLPLDAPLPPAWSAREVLAASAELLGDSRRSALRRARRTLESLGLAELEGKRVSRLRPGDRRALGIAMAALGEPAVLALEQPLAGLEPSEQTSVASVLERALLGRGALVSMAELPGSPCEDALAAQSSELLFVSDQRLAARGSYRELCARARSYRVVVQRSVEALSSRLTAAGYVVRRMLTSDLATLIIVDDQELGTVPLFRAALGADAPIIELVATSLGGAVSLGAAPGEDRPLAGPGPAPALPPAPQSTPPSRPV
jgi:ABC-type cobalamin/Fe3+-siderophores transport system ATPase subunit